ncbi:cephalosporin-C deacetylase [Anoxybacillus tepidamans]|uniref:Cephalosporin-C deacetylase n=1 Tax=Anoxybacteroides tepidamans TaxID=265948 RepID=A0A7W8IU44_9BACL|nr:alpha/beta fold hydrolase [Anoxybacillus tepidamans]MBB5325734.1 cephalosporin-C deacetylase [Anoxybacillus tepidamans]
MHLDMPLEELKQYMGKNPRPSDFEEYWDRALQELERQSLEYTLVPADFQTEFAECYHLYFTGVGNAKVHCKLVKPKKQQRKGPGIAIFHGYSVDSGDWLDKIAYAAQGFTVLAMDCRGQGGLSEDPLSVAKGPTLRGHIIRGLNDPNPDKLYYRNVFLDTVQTVRVLKSIDGVDPERIGVFGISQGGALSIACSALEPSVKKTVAVYPFLSDYKRAWEMDIFNSAYEEIAYYFRCFDPNHEREEEIFRKLGYIDIQHLADRIQANVLWVTAMRDNICPPSTQFAAYNKIQSEKEMLIYHEYGHEYLPGLADIAFQRFLNL